MRRPRPQNGSAKSIVGSLVALLAGAVVFFPVGTTESAIANGDTRTITLHHAHTQETITATYLVDGRYDAGVLDKLNWFLRDWRRNEATHMDPRLFDVIWEVYRESGSRMPIDVMSAYRSPETNAMLRRRSRGVAEHSQHILGKAMDQHYVDVSMSRIREIAMRLQRGGVGFYPTAGTPFVHMDVGGVRHWPRMSYDQLSRLFPDGKTVHIPSNCQPLPGYEQARAELAARGDGFDYPTVTEVKSKGFFAWLFGGGDEDEDVAAARDNGRGRTRTAALDRVAPGSAAPMSDSGMGKDAGARSFFSWDASRSQGTATVAQQPGAEAPASGLAPQSRRILAKAMGGEERSWQEVAAARSAVANASGAAAARPTRAPVTSPAGLAPALAGRPVLAEAPAALAEAPTTLVEPPAALAGAPALAAATPLPPRRPVELAAAGPGAPLPPLRPTEFASATPANAAKPDPLGGLIARLPAGRPADLPVAITGPSSPGRIPHGLAAALAYAAPPVAGAAVRPAVPLPVERPALVAARLDRSNFRSLTGSAKAARTPARTSLGSALSALRPAAAASAGPLTARVSTGPIQSFGRQATELPADRFAGAAVSPVDRIVTSSVVPAGRLHTTTE